VLKIRLNEDPVRKPKPIALKSKGKPSKALKANESKDESPVGDSEEALVVEMFMLFNRLQCLARKNEKFLSRVSVYKSSMKEDQKGYFNCKEHDHFIADCPHLQKDKSKNSNFKSNKFKRQIKQSMMATLEDLDNESGFDKDEANVVVGLVATVASDPEYGTDSKYENVVYSKIPRAELIESLKELFTHFEHRSNELKI